MSRKLRWVALGWGVGLAAAGAATAYLLAGGPWAAAGALVGAVTGSFAPSVYDRMRERASAQRTWLETAERAPPRSRARLLDPRREVVGFVGRDDELLASVAWCEDDRAPRLRLVTGPGGVGKTRLAVEFTARMSSVGWQCERVADGKEAEAISALRAVTRARALLVVDYAETRRGLRQMLTALAGEQGQGVRVLLLARSAGDWWEQLGVGEPEVWDMTQAAKSAELALSVGVAKDLSDADVIVLAVRAFARELGAPERVVQIHGTGTGRRRVLDLHAAALVAVLDVGRSGTVQVDIGSVLGELLRNETHFWYHSARVSGLSEGPDGLSPLMLRRLVAAASLFGAATEEEARVLSARVPGLSPSAKAARWLRELYPPGPGEADWLGSLQPDRLAELHTVRELAASEELSSACLNGLDVRQARRAVTLLARASADDPQAETLLSEALPNAAGLIADLDAPVDTLIAIYNAIPYPSVILAPAAASLAQRILALLPEDSSPATRAYWLSHLGIWFWQLGRLAEALPVTEEAVAIYRELAAASPDRYRPGLAASLSNLGAWFSELGRPVEALPAEQEAVTIRRELAAANPDRYRSDLASSLSNLGTWLSELGRPAEALPVTEEAVAMYRELAAASPDRYWDRSPNLRLIRKASATWPKPASSETKL